MTQVTMPLENLATHFAESGSSPADATKRLRVRTAASSVPVFGVPSGSLQVFPRVAEPGNAGIVGMSSVYSQFANDQEAVTPGGFEAAAGAVEFAFDGLRLHDVALTAQDFTIGLRHFVIEGIIRVNSPLSQTWICDHGGENLSQGMRGSLRVNFDLDWAWVQGNLGQQLAVFDEVPALLSQPYSLQYMYFHLERHYDDAGTYIMRLTVNGETQEFSELSGPLSNPSTLHEQTLGMLGDLYGEAFAYLLWVRSGGSDTQISGAVGNDPWSAPTVYEDTTYEAHGDYSLGWLDGGADDEYWKTLQIGEAYHSEGSQLLVRAVALNTVPAGSLSGVWNSGEWQSVATGTHEINLHDSVNGYPQGRYLLLQHRWIPSSSATLNGSTSLVHADAFTGLGLTAHHYSVEPAAPGVSGVLPFSLENSETVATLEIPVLPNYPGSINSSRPVNRFPTTSGKSRTHGKVTRSRTQHSLHWPSVTNAEKAALQAFLKARGNVEPFLCRTGDDPTLRSMLVISDELTWTPTGPNRWKSSDLSVMELF